MPKLPITAATSISGGVMTITLTDADGHQFASATNVADAGAPPMDAIRWMRQWTWQRLAEYLTWDDVPSSFSVQIGLDTSMRELDLL